MSLTIDDESENYIDVSTSDGYRIVIDDDDKELRVYNDEMEEPILVFPLRTDRVRPMEL